MRRIGSQTIANQMAALARIWRNPTRLAPACSTSAPGSQSRRGLGDRLDLDPKRHRQGRVSDLVVETCLLRAELLDLASDVG